MKYSKASCFLKLFYNNQPKDFIYQRIDNFETQHVLNVELLIIEWNDSSTLDDCILYITRTEHLKRIIFRVGFEGLSSLHILLNKNSWKKLKIPSILIFNSEKQTTDSKRFQLSTVFGNLSLSKVTKNHLLRSYYKYQSYNVHIQGRNDAQYYLVKEESKLLEYGDLDLFNIELNNELDHLSLTGNYSTSMIDKLFTESKSIVDFLKSSVFLKSKMFFNKSLSKSIEEVDVRAFPEPNPEKENPRDWDKVLITGWYGTETAGDKAILGEIIYRLKHYNPSVEIYLSSIDMRVSWQTRIEMNLDVKHIQISEMNNVLEKFYFDAVIMGGGPLMESSQIVPIARLFHNAAKLGLQRVIFGCGVGPIHCSEMEIMISNIIKLSTVAIYRDKESLEYAINLGGNLHNSILGCDPAVAFAKRWNREASIFESKKSNFTMMLRQQTNEYYKSNDIDDCNHKLINNISTLINKLSNESDCGSVFNLIAMHQYWRGNDDRFLNYNIKKISIESAIVNPNLEYLSVFDILSILKSSKSAIAMRYHGHIFSIALKKPFVSIDYTGNKGKVSNLLDRISYSENVIKFDKVSSDLLENKLKNIDAKYEDLEKQMGQIGESLENKLFTAYEYFWN